MAAIRVVYVGHDSRSITFHEKRARALPSGSVYALHIAIWNHRCSASPFAVLSGPFSPPAGVAGIR